MKALLTPDVFYPRKQGNPFWPPDYHSVAFSSTTMLDVDTDFTMKLVYEGAKLSLMPRVWSSLQKPLNWFTHISLRGVRLPIEWRYWKEKRYSKWSKVPERLYLDVHFVLGLTINLATWFLMRLKSTISNCDKYFWWVEHKSGNISGGPLGYYQKNVLHRCDQLRSTRSLCRVQASSHECG